MVNINILKSIPPSTLLAVDVPEDMGIGDGIKIIAILEFDSPTTGKRLPLETDAFQALRLFASFASYYNLGALMGEEVPKVCASEIAKIPRKSCWGFVQLKRRQGMALVAMFNRSGKLTDHGVTLIKQAWAGIATPRLLNRIDWDWWNTPPASGTGRKGRGNQDGEYQPRLYTVEVEAWRGRPIYNPLVIACLNHQTNLVVATGIVLPEEPHVILFPVRYNANTLNSMIISIALQKRPGSTLSVAEIADRLKQKLDKVYGKTYVANTLASLSHKVPIFKRLSGPEAEYILTFQQVLVFPASNPTGTAAEILGRIT